MSVKDYHYLCFNCGFITPYEKWTFWEWSDDGLIPSPPEESDPICRCPVCQWDHRDDDSNPGIMDGSLSALTVERERARKDWEDTWLAVEEEVFGL